MSNCTVFKLIHVHTYDLSASRHSKIFIKIIEIFSIQEYPVQPRRTTPMTITMTTPMTMTMTMWTTVITRRKPSSKEIPSSSRHPRRSPSMKGTPSSCPAQWITWTVSSSSGRKERTLFRLGTTSWMSTTKGMWERWSSWVLLRSYILYQKCPNIENN